MRLDICGVDLYKVDVLRSLVHRMKVGFISSFTRDIEDNVDRQCLANHVVDTLTKELSGGEKATGFNAWLANIWIKKHNDEFKQVKKWLRR